MEFPGYPFLLFKCNDQFNGHFAMIAKCLGTYCLHGYYLKTKNIWHTFNDIKCVGTCPVQRGCN